MKPVYHITVSAFLGLIFLTCFHSIMAAAACLFCGVLIDLDHHLDYWIAKGEVPWRYKDLVYFCATDKNHKMYLWFHSYESLIVLWLAIVFFDLGLVWVGAAVGLTVHVICDQFTNPLHPMVYFLTFRIKHRFKKEALFEKDFFKQVRPY